MFTVSIVLPAARGHLEIPANESSVASKAGLALTLLKNSSHKQKAGEKKVQGL